MNRLMNYPLVLSAFILSWTALHIIASEREQGLRDLQARRAADAALADQQRRQAQEPVVVR